MQPSPQAAKPVSGLAHGPARALPIHCTGRRRDCPPRTGKLRCHMKLVHSPPSPRGRQTYGEPRSPDHRARCRGRGRHRHLVPWFNPYWRLPPATAARCGQGGQLGKYRRAAASHHLLVGKGWRQLVGGKPCVCSGRRSRGGLGRRDQAIRVGCYGGCQREGSSSSDHHRRRRSWQQQAPLMGSGQRTGERRRQAHALSALDQGASWTCVPRPPLRRASVDPPPPPPDTGACPGLRQAQQGLWLDGGHARWDYDALPACVNTCARRLLHGIVITAKSAHAFRKCGGGRAR